MNRFIKRTVAMAWCGAAAAGCNTLQEVVDPCYPERYEFASRRETLAALSPQVQNGHVLDQTVWNFYFDQGTDRLTASGLDHLAYVARRRPHPDPVLYLQTAQDVSYNPANPEKLVQDRRELDEKRIKAIKSFLGAQTAGRPVEFQVLIHDPADTSLSGVGIGNAVQQMQLRFRGGLPSSGGGVSGSSSGISGGAGSTGSTSGGAGGGSGR